MYTTLQKNKMLKIDGITKIEYFTKGHRGILYTGKYKSKNVVIKAKLPESMAEGRIENEGKWLKILNKHKVGPKLIKAAKDYFFYEYVTGEFFVDFVKKLGVNEMSEIAKGENSSRISKGNRAISEHAQKLKVFDKNKKIILKLIKECLEQCFILDSLKVDKEELHHPLKHILITKQKKVVMLDFERCHIVEYPKNVTQFVVFLMRFSNFFAQRMIKIDKDRMIGLARLYKRYQTRENLEKIFNAIQ